MSEERLNEIRETVKSIVFLSDVNGGFTSQNIKFVELWNYTMKLQEANIELEDRIKKLEKKIKLVKQYDFDKVGRYELLEILKGE